MCPFCALFPETNGADIKRLVEEEVLRIHTTTMLDQMSTTGDYSTRAANAAACVYDSEPSSFLEFENRLFAHQPKEGTPGLTDERIEELASTSDAPEELGRCIADLDYEPWLHSTVQTDALEHISGTPSIFINGQLWDSRGALWTEPGKLRSAILRGGKQLSPSLQSEAFRMVAFSCRMGNFEVEAMGSSVTGRFGHAVRARRAEIGISLEQLSDATGISRGTLSRIENQALNTSLTNAVAISSVLGVEITDLLRPTESTIVRKGESIEFSDESGVSRTTIMQPPNGPELVRYELPPGTSTVTFAPHPPRSFETAHIVTGSMIYTHGAEDFELGTGDTITIPADQEHVMRNPFESHCTVLVLLTGA